MTRCTCRPEPNGVCESCFTQQVIDLAKLRGWFVYHTWNSRHSQPGFPDLILIRPETHELLALELKREGKKATEEQELWLALFGDVRDVQSYCWTPSHWRLMEEALK